MTTPLDLRSSRAGALLLACSGVLPLGDGAAPSEAVEAPALEALWGPRAAEHVLNRAAFGAPSEEVVRWAEAGPVALVDHLLHPGPLPEPFFVEPFRIEGSALRGLDRRERRVALIRARSRDRGHLQAFTSWWIDEMVAGDAPLRERMTLFWHDLLPSTMTKVKRSESMIRQNELFRAQALGSYAELLRSILRDPAMLTYLDAGSNRKANPNENLAREAMELFSLGEGNYTEEDVREAARALTGRSVDGDGQYVESEKHHDRRRKQILGQRGPLDGDDLADILLAQPSCARYVAARLLAHFEGVVPDEQRLESYAETLREHDYELRPFLRRLFLDPDFYRPEILGARVSSPVEYVVGIARRLEIHPPPLALARASELLGQELFEPPSVAGWDDGEHWITTSTLMDRGNVVGLLLGVLERQGEERAFDTAGEPATGEAMSSVMMEEIELVPEPDSMQGSEMAMESMSMMSMQGSEPDDEPGASRVERFGRLLDKINYMPRVYLAARLERRGATSDARIADELLEDLLGVEPPPETRAWVEAEVERIRAQLGVDEDALVEAGARAEPSLRALAHEILALPEGQLH